jgi:hypothetical protein
MCVLSLNKFLLLNNSHRWKKGALLMRNMSTHSISLQLYIWFKLVNLSVSLTHWAISDLRACTLGHSKPTHKVCMQNTDKSCSPNNKNVSVVFQSHLYQYKINIDLSFHSCYLQTYPKIRPSTTALSSGCGRAFFGDAKRSTVSEYSCDSPALASHARRYSCVLSLGSSFFPRTGGSSAFTSTYCWSRS